METPDYVTLLSLIGNALLLGFITVTKWVDARDAAQVKAEADAKQAEWEEADRAHKRKMEELAIQASLEAKNLSLVVSQSKRERATQIDNLDKKLTQQISDNTKVSTDAFREANGVNAKLSAMGEARLDAIAAAEPMKVEITKMPDETT